MAESSRPARGHLARADPLLAEDGAAVLAEPGEDLTGHPVLELPGYQLVRLHGKLVEAALSRDELRGAVGVGDTDGMGVDVRVVRAPRSC